MCPLSHVSYEGLASIILYASVYIYGVHTVFLAGKSPNIRSYIVYTYGAGQP
jgi:hypothetical protein